MTPTPESLYDKESSIKDSFSKTDVKLPPPKVHGGQYGGGQEVKLDITCTLTAATACYRSLQERTKQFDVILLCMFINWPLRPRIIRI